MTGPAESVHSSDPSDRDVRPTAPGGQPSPIPVAPAGYPDAPQYPEYADPRQLPPGYVLIAPSGRSYWGLLFLLYIPNLGLIVGVVVALVRRPGAKRSPSEIVRGNARWAANWALSYAIYLVCVYAILIETVLGTLRNGRVSGLIAIPVLLFFAVGIYCLVTLIIGSVTSNRVVHRPALAIPFFRS